MAPKLYMYTANIQGRACQMVAKEIGLKMQVVETNVAKGENLKPEFLKLNPTHTVPTLVDDDGFVLWESHAILPYLVEKYGKNDSLYPKDPKRRAIVDQQLHFDAGICWNAIAKTIRPVIFQGQKFIGDDAKTSLYEVYGFMEAFLERRIWIAGNAPTIADYSLVASISTISSIVPIDSTKYPKLTDWLKNCQDLAGYDANRKGLELFTAFIKERLQTT